MYVLCCMLPCFFFHMTESVKHSYAQTRVGKEWIVKIGAVRQQIPVLTQKTDAGDDLFECTGDVTLYL